MQKILHIPNYFPPHIGGIEMTANDIVNSLKGKYEQKVICLRNLLQFQKQLTHSIF